jgi:hypothetical protein
MQYVLLHREHTAEGRMLGVAGSRIWNSGKRRLPALLARSRAESLVFRYPPFVAAPADPVCAESDAWLTAAPCAVEYLFSDDPQRRDLFLDFLRQGCTGLFLIRDGRRLCHRWYSPPGSSLPAHLPVACRRKGGYWVFFCRVREESRGQGLYKGLLMKMVSSIREADPLASVVVDTEPQNLPARRAIQAAGFLPCGKIVGYKFGIPSKWRRIFGRWYLELPHPPYEPLGAAPSPLVGPASPGLIR